MTQCSIRLATPADAGILNDIQNHYVLNSTAAFHTEPLTLEERFAWRTNRTSAHPVTVAQAEGRIVGWGALELFRSRRAYRHTAEFSVYVHHAWHRRGIGLRDDAPSKSWNSSHPSRGCSLEALIPYRSRESHCLE